MDTSLENAVKYISDELLRNPLTNRSELIELVSQKFDLTPLQTEFLINKYILSQ